VNLLLFKRLFEEKRQRILICLRKYPLPPQHEISQFLFLEEQLITDSILTTYGFFNCNNSIWTSNQDRRILWTKELKIFINDPNYWKEDLLCQSTLVPVVNFVDGRMQVPATKERKFHDWVSRFIDKAIFLNRNNSSFTFLFSKLLLNPFVRGSGHPWEEDSRKGKSFSQSLCTDSEETSQFYEKENSHIFA